MNDEQLDKLVSHICCLLDKIETLVDQNIEMNTMAMPMIKKMLPVCEKIFGAMEPYGDALAAILARQLADQVGNDLYNNDKN